MKKYLPLILSFSIFILFFVITKFIPEEDIRNFIIEKGSWGPIFFTFFMLITYIIAPFSGTPILFAGFYIFGRNVIFLANLAELISFISNFYISRIWGKPILMKILSKNDLQKVEKYSQNYGFVTLFVIRLFLGNIHEFISYASGLTSIKFSHYFLASISTLIIHTFIWYYLAKYTLTPTFFTILTLAMAGLLPLIFWVGIKIWKKIK